MTKAEAAPWHDLILSRLPVARTLFPIAIDIHGDVAIAFYYYQLTARNEAGAETLERGRWMDVYRNTGGGWLLIADSGGATP